MAGRRKADRCIVLNYTGKISSMEIRIKIMRLFLEDMERGILSNGELQKQ